MRRAGVVVAHCAGSNINLCSGVSPVREMLQQGIWVTLGSDIAGGACLPMYKVATMSIRASKIKRIETDWSEDLPDGAGGLLSGYQLRPPLFRGRGRLRPRQSAPRHRGG